MKPKPKRDPFERTESTEPVLDQDIFAIKDINVLHAIAAGLGIEVDGTTQAIKVAIHKARRGM